MIALEAISSASEVFDTLEKVLDLLIATRKCLLTVLTQRRERLSQTLRILLERQAVFIFIMQLLNSGFSYRRTFTQLSLSIVMIRPSLKGCTTVLSWVKSFNPSPSCAADQNAFNKR
jgi:hypothetical protein